MQYHVLNMKKSDFFEKVNKNHEQNVVKSGFNVSMYCDFIKKWLKYYTCNECEDEVIRKGHLTKLQKAVHVDNVKYIKSEQYTILPILKHVWAKGRSSARSAGE